MTSTAQPLKNPLEYRQADHAINEIFLKRWSPRAMSGEKLDDQQLFRLFEAARWAPSTYNEQEWRFLYAHRETPSWDKFFDLLVDANQQWCKQASTLVVIVSDTRLSRNGKPNSVHSFDAGAAFENLALQGTFMGLVIHPMAGFDRSRAREVLEVPERFAVDAMFAVGHPGDPADLPESLRENETPSGRRPLSETICEGTFNFTETSSE